MQIGTVRNFGGHDAVRVDGDELVRLPFTTKTLLENQLWDAAVADAHDGVTYERISITEADWAPLIPDPGKIICVGLNYHEHVKETGSETPAAPTYFAKYTDALIGANDDIQLPRIDVSTSVDWEVELTIVIGSNARHVSAANALDHVAGYTVLNDVSVRDYQKRTKQFLAGKTFESATPVGPVMTTTDELGDGSGLALQTTLDGVVKQSSTTDELVFGVRELVADLSAIATLRPGDIIATGTPSGVGAARKPPEWLTPGATVVCSVEGIGELHNRCVLPE